MATIRKREGQTSKTSYQVQVRLRGESARTRTFKRLTDAKAWARDIESKMSGASTFRPRKSADAPRRPGGQVHPRGHPQEGPTTGPAQSATRLEWWKEQIGHRYLAEIRPSDIAGVPRQAGGEDQPLRQTPVRRDDQPLPCGHRRSLQTRGQRSGMRVRSICS